MKTYELALRGFLMGLCDIIPGVSGGTIAFITGIYARFIAAVDRSIDYFSRGIWKREKPVSEGLKDADFHFLLTVVLGILAGLLLGATVMSHILNNYFVYAVSFFLGLILASSKVIFDDISDHRPKNTVFGLLGLLIGASFAALSPQIVQPGLLYLFISGFLAVSAMFLPGISGAFVLLILGVYPHMIKLLREIPKGVDELGVFTLGALIGASIISKVIHVLFEKDKHKTLYTLLGLILGSLFIPARQIIENLAGENLYAIFALGTIGFLLVVLLKKFST